MKTLSIALSVCLSVFSLACGESTSDTAAESAGSAGGKADGVGGCEDIEADFLQCTESSAAGTCNPYVLETYPDAGSCCVGDVQPYAMCPAYGGAESCDAVNEEYLGCSAATDTATCNIILREGYPDAGSCCGRDFEDYELCAAYVTVETCDAVADDYGACNESDGEVDCDQYVRDDYPQATACCDFEGYDEICALFVPQGAGSCAEIAQEYEECLEGDGPSECNHVLQEFHPWGVNCCFLDEFPDVCEAYGGGLTCDDLNERYLQCLSVEDEATCNTNIVDTYPEGGACCGHDFEDYQVCGAYG